MRDGGHRDRVFLATKGSGMPRYSPDLWTADGTPDWDLARRTFSGAGADNLRHALDGSLRRLGTDHVDLYWVHLWDGLTPVEETVRALDDAVRAGKVLHVGFSDFPAWTVARADALAEARHLTRPAAIQVEYSLAARDAERELLPLAEALGLSVLDWSPLAGGALTGKRLPGAPVDVDAPRVARADAVPHFARYRNRRTAVIAQEVVDVAAELGCSPAQVALAWVRHRSPLHVPVLGARTPRHLEDALGAVDLVLPPEALTRLDHVSAIEAGFPLEFLRAGQDGWFGPTVRRLDTRRPRPGQALLGLLPGPDGGR
jgi:aryl-alcohol dehydrogenase-like predicted oxidoreductase